MQARRREELDCRRRRARDAEARSPSRATRRGGHRVARAAPAIGASRRDRGRRTHGAVVIAAITSCTNTSNPSRAHRRRACSRRRRSRRASRASRGSRRASPPARRSSPSTSRRRASRRPSRSSASTSSATAARRASATAGRCPSRSRRRSTRATSSSPRSLSGNRNFEGRVHAEVRANYLASPPLVVAYALAGTVDIDLTTDPLGTGKRRQAGLPEGHLADAARGRRTRSTGRVDSEHVPAGLRATSSTGDEQWKTLDGARRATSTSGTRSRRTSSTRRTSSACGASRAPVTRHRGRARARAPRRQHHDRPHLAGRLDQGERPRGQVPRRARRRRRRTSTRTARAAATTRSWCAARSPTSACGTSSRPAPKGGVTRHLPDGGEPMSIFDAAMRYEKEGVPLVVLAGKEYGSGSSRDWAAKGPKLLGVRAVIAESYERIHRSNLVGMGILPLQFAAGETAAVARAHRRRDRSTIDGLDAAVERRLQGRPHAARDGEAGRTAAPSVQGDGPHRYAARGPLLQERRHPAVRAAAAAREEIATWRSRPTWRNGTRPSRDLARRPLRFVSLAPGTRGARDDARGSP